MGDVGSGKSIILELVVHEISFVRDTLHGRTTSSQEAIQIAPLSFLRDSNIRRTIVSQVHASLVRQRDSQTRSFHSYLLRLSVIAWEPASHSWSERAFAF